jgi:UrcA family protein
MKMLVIASLAALNLAALTTAQADDVDPPSTVVSYAGLNLSTPAGNNRLYVRIKEAARLVCSDLMPGSDILRAHAWQQQYSQCLTQAFNRAVAKINSPTFTAYVASRAPAPVAAPQIVADK